MLSRPAEATAGWELTPKKLFEAAVAVIQNRNTELRNGANAALVYASVSNGVPILGFRPALIQQINMFRETVEKLTMENKKYQIMPKASLLKRYAITIMLWRPMALMTLGLIPLQLLERNPGLRGGL